MKCFRLQFNLCQNNLNEFIFSFNIISLLTAEISRCNFNKISVQASISRWKIQNVDFMWKIIELLMQIVYAFRQSIETINSIWIAYLFDWVYSFLSLCKESSSHAMQMQFKTQFKRNNVCHNCRHCKHHQVEKCVIIHNLCSKCAL